jgi:hypothetical protein
VLPKNHDVALLAEAHNFNCRQTAGATTNKMSFDYFANKIHLINFANLCKQEGNNEEGFKIYQEKAHQ